MRSLLAPQPPPPRPVARTGADRQGLALLLGAVGICAVIGVAAGWTLLFGPSATAWPVIAVLSLLAVVACAAVAATIRARGHRRALSEW